MNKVIFSNQVSNQISNQVSDQVSNQVSNQISRSINLAGCLVTMCKYEQFVIVVQNKEDVP